MMKSSVVNDRVLASAKGRVSDLVASTRTDDEVIDEVYMATGARTPSAAERSVARRTLAADRQRGTETCCGPSSTVPSSSSTADARVTMRRLTDLVPSRRDAVKWGGLALAGTWVDGLVWPLRVRANGNAVTPRATAKNVIFIELGGAISPMD